MCFGILNPSARKQRSCFQLWRQTLPSVAEVFLRDCLDRGPSRRLQFVAWWRRDSKVHRPPDHVRGRSEREVQKYGKSSAARGRGRRYQIRGRVRDRLHRRQILQRRLQSRRRREEDLFADRPGNVTSTGQWIRGYVRERGQLVVGRSGTTVSGRVANAQYPKAKWQKGRHSTECIQDDRQAMHHFCA